MAQANISWDTVGPFLVWQFLIPLVRITNNTLEKRVANACKGGRMDTNCPL